jgi:hypothetical protein
MAMSSRAFYARSHSAVPKLELTSSGLQILGG